MIITTKTQRRWNSATDAHRKKYCSPHPACGQLTRSHPLVRPSGLSPLANSFRRFPNGSSLSCAEKGGKAKSRRSISPAFVERLAATYSRGSYTTTTIGKTVFDGRVRNGNGSDHSFMATKLFCTVSTVLNFKRSFPKRFSNSLKTTHRSLLAYNPRVEICFFQKEKQSSRTTD